MSARQIDLLLLGGTAITMEPPGSSITQAGVAVHEGKLVAVGDRDVVAGEFAATRAVDTSGRVLTPGLINAHQHTTADPLARGFIPDGLDHHTLIGTWLHALHSVETEQDEELAALLCCSEMLRYGTTAFLEAGTSWSAEAVAAAIEHTGILGVTGKRVADTPHSPPQFRRTTAEALAALEQAVAAVQAVSKGNARPAVSLVGHSTASDELLIGASDMAKDLGLRLSMHLSPVEADVQAFLDRSGRRPVAHLEHLGILGPHLTLTHMIHASDEEVELLGRRAVSIVVCPLTACRLGYGLSRHGRHPEMLAGGANLALGGDNRSAGNSLDLLTIAPLLGGLYADGRQTAGVFDAKRTFELLTLGGAKALGLEDEIGSLAPGKRADIVVWRTDGPEWQPRCDPHPDVDPRHRWPQRRARDCRRPAGGRRRPPHGAGHARALPPRR